MVEPGTRGKTEPDPGVKRGTRSRAKTGTRSEGAVGEARKCDCFFFLGFDRQQTSLDSSNPVVRDANVLAACLLFASVAESSILWLANALNMIPSTIM